MWKDVVHLLIVSRHFGGLPCAKLVPGVQSETEGVVGQPSLAGA